MPPRRDPDYFVEEYSTFTPRMKKYRAKNFQRFIDFSFLEPLTHPFMLVTRMTTPTPTFLTPENSLNVS